MGTVAPPVDVGDMSAEQFRQFLHEFDHVCCDCDGVLWSGGVPLEGAGAAVTRLAAGKSLTFVSNNSTSTPQHYRELFTRAGVDHGYERLITPAWALSRFLQSSGLEGPLYCAACEQTVAQLTEAGFQCITGPDQANPDLSSMSALAAAPPGVRAVVLDSDYAMNIHKLHRCVSALHDPAVLFLSGALDRHVPLAPGVKVMGAGVFTWLVSAASARAPLVLAKPARAFGDMLLQHARIPDPARTLFIGDSMEQDIKFARTMGFRSLLVLSGVTARAELMSAIASGSSHEPTGVSHEPTGVSHEPTGVSHEPTSQEGQRAWTPDYYATALGTLLDKMDTC